MAAGAIVILLTGAASARTCYTLFDRNNNVVYRDTFSPVDLSDQGEPHARSCASAANISSFPRRSDVSNDVHFRAGEATALSVDGFLVGLQPSTRASAGTITTAPQGTRGVESSPAPAPSAATKRGSASGAYK
jgi:hypothetical protein